MDETNEANHPKSEHNWFIRWKHTAVGRICWLVLDIIIVYIFASLAIDSGTIWQYGVAIFFAIDGVYNLIRLIGKLTHGRRKTTA